MKKNIKQYLKEFIQYYNNLSSCGITSNLTQLEMIALEIFVDWINAKEKGGYKT